jgi:hypothetical protein
MAHDVPAATRATLANAYAAFNARDIDGVLVMMHPDVDWANGMEGGFVHGHDAVRQYWTRQWLEVDPRVEPISYAIDEHGRVVIDVHQVVRTRAGEVVVNQMVQHAYTIADDGLIRRMDILE